MVATHGLQGNVGLLVGGCRMLDGVCVHVHVCAAIPQTSAQVTEVRAFGDRSDAPRSAKGGRDRRRAQAVEIVQQISGMTNRLRALPLGSRVVPRHVGTLVRLCTDAKNPPVSPGTSRTCTPIARSLYANTAGLQVTQAHLKTAQRQQTSDPPHARP